MPWALHLYPVRYTHTIVVLGQEVSFDIHSPCKLWRVSDFADLRTLHCDMHTVQIAKSVVGVRRDRPAARAGAPDVHVLLDGY